jgi:hypothetical protein
MTDNVILEGLKKFIEVNVAAKIKLLEYNKKMAEYKLVIPAVFECYIPPNNYLPAGIDSPVPCIFIGLEDGSDDGTDATLNIRLTFVVYNPGEYGESGVVTPNYQGYKDLLNLITLTKRELAQAVVIGVTTIERPFTWGIYEEPPYPLWYGWLKFSVKCAPMEYIPSINEQYL